MQRETLNQILKLRFSDFKAALLLPHQTLVRLLPPNQVAKPREWRSFKWRNEEDQSESSTVKGGGQSFY
jgi:hypothetical protein